MGADPADVRYLNGLASGYRLSQVLYVFVELGIADELAAGPRSVPALAERTGSHPSSLRRLLRMATALGLVAETYPDRFALTGRGALLRADAPDSLRPRARSIGTPSQWATWGELLATVRTGAPAFPDRHGTTSFDFFDRTSGAGEAFQDRMTVEARRRGAAIADACDFSAARRLVDVGGGTGGILAAILARCPAVTGVLFDLPYALEGAPSVLAEAGVADRVELVAGDFRAGVPPDADAYLLSAILHSWNDADSVRLLASCLRYAERVVVVDEVIDTRHHVAQLLLKDLQLMVHTNGRQRTEGEFRALLAAAGADLVRVARTGLGDTVMEAVPRR
jgi:SAM-dependent methyltransferase